MKVSKSEIAKWMKDEVEFLRKNDSYSGSYLRLDDYVALVICWEEGFGEEKRDDVIQSTSEPDYALCYSLREIDSNSDFNNIEDWKYASNEDLGIECESSSIIGNPNDEYFNSCADYVIDEYNELNDLGEKKEEKLESKDKLDESTSNFKSLGNLPLLVFSIEDSELDEEGDIVTLDNFEVEDLRDRLDNINDYLKDKQYELSDEIYDLEMKDSLSDEEDKRLDELKDIDGAFEDLHFDIEDGYYAGCQVTTSYPKSFDKLPKDVQKEVLKKLKEIKRDFNLTQLEVSNVFSNGETIYDKVEENKKSINEGEKSLKESSGEFRSIIAKHFNYNASDKFIDIVSDVLSGIDDFNDQEAIKLTLDDSLIYYSDQWEIMMHYQLPSEANLDEAILSLYNDVEEICKEIASGKNENLNEEVRKSVSSRKSIKEDAKSGEKVNLENVRKWLKSGGATIDAKTGEAINFKDGYEISLKGTEEQFTKLNLDKDEDVQKVVDGVNVRLNKSGIDAIGLWVSNGIVYLDNSIHFIGSEEEALERGRKEEQLSILRWEDMTSLDCNAKKNIVPTKPIKESKKATSTINDEDDTSMITQDFINELSKEK